MCISTFALLLLVGGRAVDAQILDDETLAIGDETVGEWYDFERRSMIESAVDPDVALDALLDAARHRVSAALGQDCSAAPAAPARRACTFLDNLAAYEAFLLADLECRVATVLEGATDPSEPAGDILTRVSAAAVSASRSRVASLEVSTPESIGPELEVFGQPVFEEQCDGAGDLHVQAIVIDNGSTARSDKLVLAYAYALSLRAFEFNRANQKATARLISEANERWSDFETNVIHDQYPWETLLFNDWFAGGSARFRGSLTHPPTQQIRALHPVPTAILDVNGENTLFRPRLTVEVLGLRYLDEDDEYKAKRGYSIIATLQAEAGESTGWGLMYTWQRGSIGVVYQETSFDDNVVGLVFGVDLANQIDSGRNDLMQNWKALREELAGLQNELP